jgi:hypothetical protein
VVEPKVHSPSECFIDYWFKTVDKKTRFLEFFWDSGKGIWEPQDSGAVPKNASLCLGPCFAKLLAPLVFVICDTPVASAALRADPYI